MKKLLVILLLPLSAVAAGFVSPVNFDGSAEAKKKVIMFIEQKTAQSLRVMGQSDSYVMKEALEQQALESFKQLTKAKDTALLKKVIKSSCQIASMCDYTMIQAMYEQELESKNKKLEW